MAKKGGEARALASNGWRVCAAPKAKHSEGRFGHPRDGWILPTKGEVFMKKSKQQVKILKARKLEERRLKALQYGWIPTVKAEETKKRTPKTYRLPKKPDTNPVASDQFLSSYEWRRVRMEALKKYGPKCMCCGATPATGAVMNVDHIKPRKLWPSLALDIKNLQILCNECNHGKGNWDMTDWRKKSHA